jgi:hypothetical protein
VAITNCASLREAFCECIESRHIGSVRFNALLDSHEDDDAILPRRTWQAVVDLTTDELAGYEHTYAGAVRLIREWALATR